MRAPVSRSRPLSRRCRRLLVLDDPLVGGLGLAERLELGDPHQLVRRPDPRGAAGVLGCAGGDLEAP